ncbi:hypothetical protein BV22DRAFT_398883 [Leucogyrophana mollusca]|uniref:Uncharacterized protein n=1 Tax=Leucogyrophana mollusca TaxID=85980 RepID=A0ACB8BM73_9AGAM|nr:hypothetical protein BV22DRAFT_398883 [Leucogyrophana mollusca]
MSSGDEDFEENGRASSSSQSPRPREVQKIRSGGSTRTACDECRRKKIRCNRLQVTAGAPCSHCRSHNLDCAVTQSQHPPTSYIKTLQGRLEQLEKVLEERLQTSAPSARDVGRATINPPTPPSLFDHTAAIADSDDEDEISTDVWRRLERVPANPMQRHFFGKSSNIKFIDEVFDMRKAYVGNRVLQSQNRSHASRLQNDGYLPWERELEITTPPEYVFPDDDLGMNLVDLYFEHVNIMSPFLHRPTFVQKVRNGVHLRDSAFGAVYLLVCAVGSRFSDDPRVLVDDMAPEHSCGWIFFNQVELEHKTFHAPARLEDIQAYCLSALFLQGTCSGESCWAVIGIAIRLAQEVGAHRRKIYRSRTSIETELWKRVFWVLISFDSFMSSYLGRPCAVNDEDLDLEPPIECDDEYWPHPNGPAQHESFKQPPDKPSSLAFFTHFLKLNEIIALALRTIYTTNKSKTLLGHGGLREMGNVVAKLDSALEKWVDALPDHLRWDPSQRNVTFVRQSCALNTLYCYVRIVVHRPFIPSPRKSSPLPLASLAVCTSAARLCSQILAGYLKTSGGALPEVQLGSFTSGVFLLLDLWDRKRSGTLADSTQEMEEVQTCMSALQLCEKRWRGAGSLCQKLQDLALVTQPDDGGTVGHQPPAALDEMFFEQMANQFTGRYPPTPSSRSTMPTGGRWNFTDDPSMDDINPAYSALSVPYPPQPLGLSGSNVTDTVWCHPLTGENWEGDNDMHQNFALSRFWCSS